MTKTEELKRYIVDQDIFYQVNDAGVWFIRFADMTAEQQEYIMCPYFAECGFSGMFGIHI